MTAPGLCFHTHKGSNVHLNEARTCARRQTSFANSIVFSDRPLRPAEVFMVRIDAVESGWTGHLRMGLTHLDPGQQPRLPMYAVPDLNFRGHSWVVAIARRNNAETFATDSNALSNQFPPLRKSVDGGEASTSSCVSILPADVGSCVGVYYRVCSDAKQMHMHLVVNGQDNVFLSVPYTPLPVYAIADVYGNTKQITIISPPPNNLSLQAFCCRQILSCLKYAEDVHKLPLPLKLRLNIFHRNYSNNPSVTSDPSANLLQRFL